MEIVISILLIVVSFFTGDLVLQIIYVKDKKFLVGDCFLMGGMILIGVAEVIHITAAFLGYSLSKSTVLYVGIVSAIAAVSILSFVVRKLRVGKTNTKAEHRQYQTKEWLTLLLFGSLVFAQLFALISSVPVYTEGDLTLETVQTCLHTDTVGQVNPLTGTPYEVGVPSRLKILCLPTFYAFLCNFSGIEPARLVWRMIPALVLVATYAVYHVISKILFSEHRFYRGCFMVLVAVLLYIGDYMPGADAFHILHGGFRGVAIRGAILVPYTVSLVLRKRYRLLPICVLTEASVVWTLYGMGACFLVIGGMLATECIIHLVSRKTSEGGNEKCRNS